MIVLVATAVWISVLGFQAAKRFNRIGAVGDYQHYYFAAKAVVEGQNIYQQHDRQYGYLPAWAVLHTVFVPLGPGGAGAAFAVVNVLLLWLGFWLTGMEVMRRLGWEGRERLDRLTRALVIAVAALVMSDKVRAELRLGQTDATILVCFALALRWLERWPWLSGVMLGFIAQFKFQSLVMIPYFIVRRRWGALASTVLSSIGFALAGTLIWGWDRTKEYMQIVFGSVVELTGAAKDIADGPGLFPLAWHRSVSVPSVMARIAQKYGVSEGMLAVGGVGLLAGAAFVLGWWMFWRRGVNLFAGRSGKVDDATPRGRGLVLLEWIGLIMGALAFSPQTTVRHLFLMSFIVMVAVALAFDPARARHRVVLTLALVVFWLGIVLPPGGSTPQEDRHWHWMGGQLIVSLILFFCTLWCGLAKVRELPGAEAESPGPTIRG